MPLIFGRVLASGIMVPVNVDTDGDLQVDILDPLPAGSNLIGDVQARNLGYYSSAWRKDPLAFGYSGIVLERVVNQNLSAGANILDTSAVAASKIWVITNIAVAYSGTIGGVKLYIEIYSGTTPYPLFSEVHVVNDEYLDRQGWWVLAAGDKIRLEILGATAGDDAYLIATGFYVDIL